MAVPSSSKQSLMTLRFRRKKPTMLFALFYCLANVSVQEKVDWSSMPRYLVKSSVVSVWPFSVLSVVMEFLDLDILLVLHLSRCKTIPQVLLQDGTVLLGSDLPIKDTIISKETRS